MCPSQAPLELLPLLHRRRRTARARPDTQSGSDRWSAGCWWNSRGGFGKRWPLEWQHSLLHVRRTDVRSVSLPDLNLPSKPLLETDRFRRNQVVGTAGFLLTCLFVFFSLEELFLRRSEIHSKHLHFFPMHFLTFINNYHCNRPCKKKKKKGVGWSKTRVIYGLGLEAGKHVGILNSLIYSEDGQF